MIKLFWSKHCVACFPTVDRRIGFYGLRIHRLFIGFVYAGEQVRP